MRSISLPFRRLIRIQLFLALAGPFVASPILLGQENDDASQQGMQAFKAGDYDQALAQYTQAIQTNPQDAQAYFKRAYVYMTKGDDDKAIADLSQAIRIDPRYAQAYFRRAFVYMAKGDYDQATTDLTQEIQIDPKNVKAYYRRAYVYMIKGGYDQAISDLNQALQINPKFEQAAFRRNYAYLLKGDFGQAIADLNQNIQLHPQDADNYNRLAWLLATCPQAGFRDGKKAVEDATKACDLTEWKSSAEIDTLAAAYAEAGDFANAIKCENMAISDHDGVITDAQKSRLALYQTNQPYHVEKYDPKFSAVVE